MIRKKFRICMVFALVSQGTTVTTCNTESSISLQDHSCSPVISCVLPVSLRYYPRWRSFGWSSALAFWPSALASSQSFPLHPLERFYGEHPNVYPFPKPSLYRFAVRKTHSSFSSEVFSAEFATFLTPCIPWGWKKWPLPGN